MSDKDFVINPVGLPTMGATIAKKPIYLVTLENDKNKTYKNKYFVAVDKPEFLNGFVQVKGFFSELQEDEIIKTFQDLLTATTKDLFLEVLFPWHKICSIRSLVFKAK